MLNRPRRRHTTQVTDHLHRHHNDYNSDILIMIRAQPSTTAAITYHYYLCARPIRCRCLSQCLNVWALGRDTAGHTVEELDASSSPSSFQLLIILNQFCTISQSGNASNLADQLPASRLAYRPVTKKIQKQTKPHSQCRNI